MSVIRRPSERSRRRSRPGALFEAYGDGIQCQACKEIVRMDEDCSCGTTSLRMGYVVGDTEDADE
jgi:hypothetical protein